MNGERSQSPTRLNVGDPRKQNLN